MENAHQQNFELISFRFDSIRFLCIKVSLQSDQLKQVATNSAVHLRVSYLFSFRSFNLMNSVNKANNHNILISVINSNELDIDRGFYLLCCLMPVDYD